MADSADWKNLQALSERFGSLEDYKADLERYQKERAEALEAGYAEEHPLVRTPTRRAETVQRLIDRLEGNHG